MTSISTSFEPYEINLKIDFSGEMTINSFYSDPSMYVFTDNVYARRLDFEDAYSVTLYIENPDSSTSFNLTLDEGIIDIDGFPTDAYGTPVSITIDDYGAHFSNANGLVRTKSDPSWISLDSQRVYIAGTKGIDVAKRLGGVKLERWAQIFDDYGVGAMTVVNYGGDLVITDTSPPYIKSSVPSDGGFGAPTANILITIADVDSTVEPTGVVIYIQDVLAFDGSSGWKNGFTGTIFTGYKQLNAIIIPPTQYVDGEEVEVNVMATDISGNASDITYSFFIGVFGFGGAGFGAGPFGI